MATQRHWGEVRKLLEQDLLCESLKGRVRYFSTRYRKAHDQGGRVCILVDGEEVLSMPFETEYEVHFEVEKRRAGNDKSKFELGKEVADEFHGRGTYDPFEFGLALDEFLSNQIRESLHSSNWLVRMLAVLDRRIGKRSLITIKGELYSLPEWLRYFYRLRLESEKLL